MGELEKILTDIFLVKPPERLAKTMGAEGNDPIDAIMRKLYSEGISDAQSLAQWIKKYLGKLTIIEILDELDLEYDAETEPSELIAAWFGHRRIGEYAPAARPFELAKRLLEQARQAETTGNLDVRKLLTPDLESLFRCTAFFYSREILKHESCCKGQVMPEVGLEVVKPVAILSDASLGGLCNFLDCQKQLSAEPYNSGCPDKLLLADSRTRELLGKIRTMTELSAEEMITQDMAAYPGLVRELMQKWGAGESDSTIPKGCRVASSRVSGFASEVLCVDELNERIRLNGIKTETRITVGDDVLLRTSDTASVWASGLEPLPKGEKWVTSGNGPHRPPESDHGLLPASRTQVFISYSHLDKQWLDLLKTHLKPLVKYKKLAVWDDKMIKSGEKWQDRIEGALASAKVAVLLVSPNFLASDFILEIELPTLLKAAESEGLYMLWIPVSASSYDTTDLQPYQAAQEPKEPLDMLPEGRRNQVMVEICKRIAEACDDGTSEKS